jgi:hypothetical protein
MTPIAPKLSRRVTRQSRIGQSHYQASLACVLIDGQQEASPL